MENSMETPQRLKIGIPLNPATQLLSIYPKEMRPIHRRDTCMLMFITVTLFIRVKIRNQLRCLSTDE
jgi:hypothetical protein